MAQGPEFDWQEPASRDTHFLSWASKKENAWQKKEDARENLFKKGFLWTFSENRGAAAPQTPRGSGVEVHTKTRVLTGFVSTLVLVCRVFRSEMFTVNPSAEQQTFGLWPSQGTFALQKSL